MQLPYRVRTLGYRLLGGVPVRVRSGVNRGRRWSLVSTGRGYGSGRFGRDRIAALAALVRPGECFWDLGAHKGFVTLAASRLVGPDGLVIAVEPGPANLPFLRRHVAWNEAANVRIVPAAVGESSGPVAFGGQGDSLSYQVGVGDETVQLETIPGIMGRLDLPAPTTMKMDIESQEAAALRGALPVLRDDLVVLASIHDADLYQECRDLLLDRSFRLYESHEMALRTSGRLADWGGDHDILAIGPGRPHDPSAIRALALIRNER